MCGAGTDLALLKAVQRGAAYFVSPCCVGKLQASVGLVDPTHRAPSEVSFPGASGMGRNKLQAMSHPADARHTVLGDPYQRPPISVKIV